MNACVQILLTANERVLPQSSQHTCCSCFVFLSLEGSDITIAGIELAFYPESRQTMVRTESTSVPARSPAAPVMLLPLWEVPSVVYPAGCHHAVKHSRKH